MSLVGCANTQPSTSQQVTEELVGSTVSPDELRVQLERLGAEGVLSQVDIKETDPPLYRVTGPQRVIQCLKSSQGVWREDYKECEFMSLQTCEALGGKFNGCASPCRHQPGMACITMCVPVCQFQQQ
ncbi:hypothetical protein ACWJJH_14785 [Endozoicomonadaceae bacterium StTr2]